MRFALCTSSIVIVAVLAAAASTQSKWQETSRSVVGIPIAKHSRLTNGDETINIEALNAHVASVTAKVQRSPDTSMNSVDVMRPFSSKESKQGSGALPLTDNNDHLWYATISVGTPPKNFTVKVDTGTSDLFLPGPNCTSNCDGHTIYNPSSSTSSHNLNKTSTLNSTGVVVDVYSDTVDIAGLAATGQQLGVATSYPSGLAPSKFHPDGLIGMAFQSFSAYNASPVFQTLISEGQVQESVFSLKLAETGSELYLGGTNPGLYTGNFTYTNVLDGLGYWGAILHGVSGNGTTILRNRNSLIDTGTALIIGDASHVGALYTALNGTDASKTVGEGYYTFPCDAFPTISFNFEGVEFPISPDILNIGRVGNSTNCISGIVGKDVDFWVIGDVFLRNVYTAFDVGNMQIGFAKLA